jgi:hypothetical protein
VLLSVWEKATGQSKPNLAELQWVQANSALETGYGAAWNGSNNWGAIQIPDKPPCPPGKGVEVTDHHPDGTPFQWCYGIWPTPEAGAIAYIPLVTVKRPKTWAAAKAGDVVAACHELYGYYTGIGTREQGEAQRVKAVMSNATRIAKNLNEPLSLRVSGSGSAISTGAGIGAGVLLIGCLVLVLSRKGR